jgi:hypothetical protein
MRRFRQDEQQLPEAQPIADGVIMRLEHVFEVDPALMETHFRQQPMPVWDTERIVDSRWEHLDWMHGHFADELLVAGEPDELRDEPVADQPEEESRKHDASDAPG